MPSRRNKKLGESQTVFNVTEGLPSVFRRHIERGSSLETWKTSCSLLPAGPQ